MNYILQAEFKKIAEDYEMLTFDEYANMLKRISELENKLEAIRGLEPLAYLWEEVDVDSRVIENGIMGGRA